MNCFRKIEIRKFLRISIEICVDAIYLSDTQRVQPYEIFLQDNFLKKFIETMHRK